ncbi:HK97-gp10 family putative phage morphogenesis protein [Streptococcus suis]|uniref:HK97-gp10 family putative phage morphogenesis protein n=1 Tax=Streptococcus suis TaxID=1307 RepID=UPI001E30D0F6|nr:HK97-gp10 family putative phage morphogenesis protein [Streptococcus suis]MCB2859546.1 HK97 gp10 family phage protein [Streptococcus suis]MCB2868082.1 HK97 gp10 family phage protein [Streptococcus suis]MCL4882655.1 HK97 gp10 family phage protein [Streptococcus suis]MCO8202260.1 HK97 gp10 family phage protein [Streptococcus suis]MCO8213026.1 HK97 gp10 family phage protein [Streptococcus suis]
MKFVDNSATVKRELERAAIRGLIKSAMLVESQAVLLVPVNTGGLRNSIGYKVNESELVAYVGTNCEYAIYVEFGTGEFAEAGNGRKGGWLYKDAKGEVHFTYGMPPQPYLRPAFRQNQKAIKDILADCLRDLGG